MTRLNGWKRRIQCLRAVPLADKCLIVMMIILLAQSGYSLWHHELAFQESNMIDVVIRTTSAAIFGYFISANFLAGGRNTHDTDLPESPASTVRTPHAGAAPKAEIGFHPDGEAESPRLGRAQALPNAPPEPENCFQVLVVALIGMAALLLLIVARDAIATNQVATATLSQLRDFVSGSVGFLLGHTTHRPQTTAF